MHSLKRPLLLLTALALIAGGAAGCSKAARKARSLSRADNYFTAEKYNEAELEYRNVLKDEPLNRHAIGRLGIIYFEQGRLAQSFPFLTKARELDPTNPAVRVKVGFMQLALGSLADARADALAALDSDPKNTEAPLLLGETAINPKEAQELRPRFDALQKQVGDTAPLNTGMGSLLIRAGDPKGAEAAFRHALELDSKFSPAHFALGLIYLSRNDRTNADLHLKAAAETAPRRSLRRVNYADFRLKIGDEQGAKRILTDLTKEVPDYIPAWNALAQMAFMQKDYPTVETALRQISARDPDNFDAQYLGANLSLARGEVDRAITGLERLTTSYKASPQARYALALAYLSKGDSAKAFKYAGDAVNLNTNYTEAILLRAQLNIRRENPDAAIEALTQLIQRRPQVPTAYLLLGSAYSIKRDPERAVATYQQLATLYPSNSQVPLLVGAVMQDQGRNSDARKAYEKSLEIEPGNLSALQQLTGLDVSEKQYAAALTRVQTETEKQPKSAPLQSLLAEILIQQNQRDEAMKVLRHAIELDPAFQPAYMKLASLYKDSNRNQEAMDNINKVLARNPKDISALMFAATIQTDQKDYASARANYEKLLEVNPNFSPALNNLAYIYCEQFDLLDKAYEAARRARDLLPHDPATADTLGWVLFKRGDYPWALSLLQESAESLPTEPDVQFHLAMTYYMMGDEERARKTFDRALALNKDFSGRDIAAKRIATINIDASSAGPDAVASLESRIREQPDDPVALNRLASIYNRQGAPEKAANAYEAAVKLRPKNALLLIELARLYATRLHNPQRALALAKDAYQLAPDDPDISRLLGRIALEGGDRKWALSLLQQSAQRGKADPELLLDLATAYYSLGRVTDAQSNLREALKSEGTFERSAQAKQFLNFITLSGDPAKAAEALPEIKQTLQNDPDNVPALMALAAAQRQDSAAVAAACEQALKRYPDFVPAIKQLAIVKAEKPGEEQRAFELAMKAKEALPDDTDVARTLGIVMYRRGDSRGAVRLLAECRQKGVSDGTTLYYLGMAHYKLKQPTESKDALQQALAGNIPGALADEARRVLQELK